MSLSSWSLLIFAIGLASGQSNNANCSLAGQCLESLFITEATTANAQGCLEECKENQACQWFTYKPANDVCDLFKTCGYVSNENCPDCLSGQKECDSVYKCNISGRCQGLLDQDSVVETVDECIEDCRANTDCQWLTFNSFNGQCYQFQTCPDIDESCSTCTSSQRECQEPSPPQVMTKIFVTTGDPKDRGTNLTEVIDLSSPYTTCENLDYYPKPMAWGPGGLLNGTTPIICGGTSYYGYGNQTDCFLYIKGSGYVNTGNSRLTVPRTYASSVVLNGYTLFVAGGSDGGIYRDTTEFITPGKETVPGPNLPKDLYGHCITPINDTHLALLGGGSGVSDNDASKQFHILDWSTNQWTEGPRMQGTNAGKIWLSCGVIQKSNGQGNPLLVAAGGYGRSDIQFLDLTDPMSSSWTTGPDLPYSLSGGQMVQQDPGSLIYIGGYQYGSIGQTRWLFKLTCSGPDKQSCDWETLPQELQVERDDFVAMLIPDDLATCS